MSPKGIATVEEPPSFLIHTFSPCFFNLSPSISNFHARISLPYPSILQLTLPWTLSFTHISFPHPVVISMPVNNNFSLLNPDTPTSTPSTSNLTPLPHHIPLPNIKCRSCVSPLKPSIDFTSSLFTKTFSLQSPSKKMFTPTLSSPSSRSETISDIEAFIAKPLIDTSLLFHPLSHHIPPPRTSSVFQQKFINHPMTFLPLLYPLLLLPFLLPLLLLLSHLPLLLLHHPFSTLYLPPSQLHLLEILLLIILYLLDSRESVT